MKSRTLNLGGESRAKGYAREDLHDIWERYLPPAPPPPQRSVTSVTSVTKPDFQGSKVTDVTGSQRSVTDDGTGKNAEESIGGTDVTDVTLVAGNGGNDYSESLRRIPSDISGTASAPTPSLTNGHRRPPPGRGWTLLSAPEPGKGGAVTWLRQKTPPPLGPPGDCLEDIDPRWRQ